MATSVLAQGHVVIANDPQGRPSGCGTALMCRTPDWCHHGLVGLTLLIVDDHAGFRSSARALLEAEGFDVVGEAGTGLSAVAQVDRLDPDVVLLDIALPDIDGFEVCARISQRGTTKPAVVFTSTRDAEAFRQRLATSAARGFIPKSNLTGAALAFLAAGSS